MCGRDLCPIYIDGNLNGQKYVELLQGGIAERLTALEETMGVDLGSIYYMHDGCPAHNVVPARELLQEYFAGQVIGTNELLASSIRMISFDGAVQ